MKEIKKKRSSISFLEKNILSQQKYFHA